MLQKLLEHEQWQECASLYRRLGAIEWRRRAEAHERAARCALRDGANVMMAARTEANLEKAAKELDPSGERVGWVATDITDESQCERLGTKTIERFGRLDALVNVAALDTLFGGLETPMEDWRRGFETNVFGAVQLVRALRPQLAADGGGSVVLIGSQSSLQPMPSQMAYSASKSAMISAMYTMAKELGPDRIRVNTVVPTWMWGPPVEGYIAGEAERTGRPKDDIIKDITDTMAIPEIPADDDVAEAIVFFCSDRSRMITGQKLLVNAGEMMR